MSKNFALLLIIDGYYLLNKLKYLLDSLKDIICIYIFTNNIDLCFIKAQYKELNIILRCKSYLKNDLLSINEDFILYLDINILNRDDIARLLINNELFICANIYCDKNGNDIPINILSFLLSKDIIHKHKYSSYLEYDYLQEIYLTENKIEKIKQNTIFIKYAGIDNFLNRHYDIKKQEMNNGVNFYYFCKKNNFYLASFNILKYYILREEKKEVIDIFNTDILGNMNYEYANEVIKIIKNMDQGKPVLLFYSICFLIGGTEKVLLNLFEGLKKNYSIILVTKNTLGRKFEIPEGIDVIYINRDLYIGLSYTLAFLSYLANAKIFINSSNLDEASLGVYDYLKDFGIRSVSMEHFNYYFPFVISAHKNNIYQRHTFYNKIDIVTWLTNNSAYLYNQYNSNGICIANPNSFKVQQAIKKNNKTIICVGRFDDLVKGFDLTLKIFDIINKLDKEIKLIVVGKYDKQIKMKYDNDCTIEEYIGRNNISNIEFVGQQNDVTKYYELANLLILTSMSEGFGIVITEAACFGIPSIIKDIPGLDDLILEDYNGYILKDDCIEEIAIKIVNLLNNNEKYKIMSNQTKFAVKRFDRNTIIEKWNNLFKMMINNASISEIRNEFPVAKSNRNILIDYDKHINYLINDLVINSQENNKSGDYFENIKKMIRKHKNLYKILKKVKVLMNKAILLF